MKDINQVCDYVIFRLTGEVNVPLNHLKLQKLLYYIQSWFLVYNKEAQPMFQGKFQAWIHGPVNRQIYNRFKNIKNMYSSINNDDIIETNLEFPSLTNEDKDHIDTVLEVYAPYSDTQLERTTHVEEPWLEARNGYSSSQRCEVEIDETTMKRYYSDRVKNAR